MVELHVLEALDALMWLRSGDQVAERFGISPATTSRHRHRCLQVFGLSMERRHGEWQLIGPQELLLLERQVHQMARWKGRRPLRLEATYWSAPLLQSPPLEHWMLGLSNIVGVPRNLALLEQFIVDAWLAGLPDCPGPDHPELVTIPVTRMPVFFVVGEGHPLLKRASLTVEDLAEFPSLALPEKAYPLVEQSLKSMGLWNDGVRMTRYCRDRWEGKAERELVVGYGTALSLAVSGENLQALPLRLPHDSGDALVLRRRFLQHPRLLSLLAALHTRMAPVVQAHGDVSFDPDFLQLVGA
jgi:hypothetical protein